MQEIPFKQTDTVSNEYVFGLLLIVIVLAVVFVFFVRFLKSKGFAMTKKDSAKRINVIDQRLVSPTTKVYIVKVDDEEYVLTESSKNIQLEKFVSQKREKDCRKESEKRQAQIEQKHLVESSDNE